MESMDKINFDELALPQEFKNRQWLTYKEFGSIIGLGAAAIRNWHRKGIIKARQFTPRCHRVTYSSGGLHTPLNYIYKNWR